MSIHERFESMVDLYVAGGLNDAERREASEHTKACAPCGTLLRDAEEFARWVRGTVAPDAPPANLEERVISRWRKGRGRVSRNLRWWRVAGLGVAAGGLILLGNQFVLSSGVRGAAVDQRQEEIARYDEHAPVQLYTASSFSHRGLVAETYEDRKKGVYFVDEIEEKAKNTGRYDGGAGELKENASPVPSSKPPDKSSQDPAAPYQADRKLIYNGTMNLEVEAYETTYARLRDLVAAEKGFIAGADTQRLANGKIRATVTVRVSPDRFEATLAKLRELGTVRHQSISTQDVTKAYVDLESRRKSKEALVERLKKVLAEAKGSVKELMEVEVQMGKTIEEIEAIKGELKYYDNLIGLSTIVLEIVEKDLGQPFEYVQTLQSNIGITAEDAPGAYAAAQKTITEAGGQVADAKLTRQSDGSTQAFVRGRVDAERFPAVREALRKLGHVDTDTVEQQRTARGGQNGASAEAPVRKEQAVIDITVTTPAVVVTRKAQIALETSKAEEAYQAARRAIESAGGKIADGSMTGHTDGATASVRAEIDADKVPALVETLKSLGVVKNASVQHLLPPTAKPGETRLVRERGEITLTIATPPVLIAEGHTLGRTIRDTFSGSYAALMWSIEKLFVGLSLAGPWLVLALGGWLIARRVRRKKPTPPTAA